MSFGALSANAVRALNRGAKLGNFAHDTGEGSISRYHREYGGDLIWEIGSGYFGCRTPAGQFDPERFAAQAREPQVNMIEIKLSQGAKPGHGGVLPGAKVTPEIAEARAIPVGQDCLSPAQHSAFATPLELIDFISLLRELSGGKPVGFKFSLGHPWEFFGICKAMLETGIAPDFIVVDGSEGGTGAAPIEFTDHIGTPLQEALLLVHNTLTGLNLRGEIRLGASGKIISAFDIARLMALGADWCNAARGFMFALGCIQSLSCHTGRCPTGVTTQDPWRQRALVPQDKATRVYNFHRNTLHALAELIGAAGLRHPGEIEPRHIVRRVTSNEIRLVANRRAPDQSQSARCLRILLAACHQQELRSATWPGRTPPRRPRASAQGIAKRRNASVGRAEYSDCCCMAGMSRARLCAPAAASILKSYREFAAFS
jgi:glutamate synthase domain-containing protein 2